MTPRKAFLDCFFGSFKRPLKTPQQVVDAGIVDGRNPLVVFGVGEIL
jgi:hypothetical protein